MERFVSPSLAAEFESTLQPHHKMEYEVGLSWMQYAVIEHNLSAASKLYHNITFKALGRLLSVTEARAEEIATKMIQENRIKGVIDQVDGVLEFSREAESLLAWDDQILSICNSINDCATEISRKHPTLVPATP